MSFIAALRRAGPAAPTIALVFFINGTVFGNWVPRIPDVQRSLDLGEAALGLALLGLPVGSLIAMQGTGWLIARFGAARVTLAAMVMTCAAVTLPALAPSLFSLGAALAVFGAATGMLDVAMNAEADAVERAGGVPLMGLCHGMFSVGGMVGAVMGGLTAEFGIQPPLHLAVAGTGLACLGLAFGHHLPSRRGTPGIGSVLALPTRRLVGLAIICFIALMGEGAMADWSAVYLSGTLEATPVLAAAGFAAFSLAMAIGRIGSDAIVRRFGPRRVVEVGGLIAALGMGLAVTAGSASAAVTGFACVGLGYAAMVPILFRAAARAPGRTPGTNIAAVATIGYTGFLAGPPLIGFVAEAVGLGVALGLLVPISLIVTGLARRSHLPDRL
ncbi:MAG: MFS transporter [Inquilinaceae bacterium]